MKAFLVVLSFFASVAFADVNQAVIANEPNSAGQCSSLEHIGNWGYVPTNLVVEQNDDTVEITVGVLNLSCSETLSRGEVSWVFDLAGLKAPRNRDGSALIRTGVAGYVHEAEGFRPAQFTAEQAFGSLQAYKFSWKKAGLAEKLNDLRPQESFDVKFIFGFKALYKQMQAPQMTYQSFSGRYGIYVKFVKQADGQFLVQKNIVKESQ